MFPALIAFVISLLCSTLNALPASPPPMCDVAAALLISANASLGWVCSGFVPLVPICFWTGVSCDASGNVIRINTALASPSFNILSGTLSPQLGDINTLQLLRFSSLPTINGTIPTQLGALAGLTQLVLTGTSLSGTIPSELGLLTGLFALVLSANQLQGTIPPQLFNMPSLLAFYIYQNHITGTIPTTIGQLSRAVDIRMYTNQLIGPLPAQIGGLSSVQSLLLQSNAINGSLPTQIGQLVAVQSLLLFQNHLTGSLPSEIGGMVGASVVLLNDNSFTGAIPSSLGLITGMLTLQLQDNFFTSIPSEIGLLSQIKTADIHNNRLQGSVPTQLGLLTSLTYFTLENNSLQGNIPIEVGQLINLQVLALDANQLSGAIPSEVGNMIGLTEVNLQTNRLSKPIPSEIGLLTNLVVFQASTNKLTGDVPSAFSASMPHLQVLLLDHNSLDGTVASNISTLTSLQQLAIDNNLLRGQIPSLVNLTALQQLTIDTNSFSGTFPKEVFFLPSLFNFGAGYNPFFDPHPLPSEIGNLAALSAFTISASQFTGSLPTELGKLSQLNSLVAAYNSFSGTIPTELGSVATMTELWLENNALHGSIPLEIYNLTNLFHLGFANNRLNGTLAPHVGNLTLLTALNYENCVLNGSVPTEIGNLQNLQNLILNGNLFSGSLTATLCSAPFAESFVLCDDCSTRVANKAGCPLLTSVPVCYFFDSFANGHKCLGSLGGALSEVPALLVTSAVSTSTTIIEVNVSITSVNFLFLYCAAFISPTTLYSPLQLISKSYPVFLKTKQVSYNITSLLPATNYEVFCYAESTYGVAQNLSVVLASQVSITTLCCKQISFLRAPAFIPVNSTDAAFVFSYTLSSAPSSNITVRYIVSSPDVIAVQSSAVFLNSSFSLTGSFILIGPAGEYTVTLSLEGPSAAEFSVDSGGLPVLILNRGLGKPAPQLGIARFGDSGADATITFLSPTDLAAAAITTLQWPCSALLAFDGAQTSSCVWINSSAVLATFPSSVDAFVPLPSIGSLLSVKSGILRASCDGGITSSCSLNAVLNSANGTFLAPFNPIIPFVSLVVPAGFNLLDDIIIDPTATRGGGGRPWAVVDWTASTDQTFNASASLLNRLLIAASQDLSLAFPLVIPSGGIPPALYIVTLRVTNFLNQSSSASASVNVTFSHSVPQITILGSSALFITDDTPISLQSYVLPSSIPAGELLTFIWSVSAANGTLLESISSLSADPKSFKLPAFSLAPLQQYTITVTVQTNFLSASSASVQVYIARSALVASIAGGHSRAVPANQTISLDASGSTPINNTAYGALSFRWSCLIFSGSLFGSDCTGLLANVSLLGPTLRFSSGLLSSNVTYQFTVAAALDADFDTASALISLAPVGAPSVSLSISASRANIGDVVQLDGVIGAESNTSTAWNVSSSSAAVNIASISTSPVTGVFPLSVLRPSIGVSLGINTLFLSTGASYTFELTASTSGKGDISTASILLTINTPPSGGFIFSVPTIGSAFSTLFRVSSIGWVVEAGGYPLVYDFKYSVVSNTSSSPYLLLAARGLQTFVESALPAGDSAFNSTIILQSTVYDIYGAFTTSTTNVSVNGNNQTGDSLVASLYDQLNASTLTFNTDLTLQSVNTVATSLGTNSLILNETAYDSVILSLCNALRGVISVSDGSAALLNTLVNSFGTVYDPSKVIQVQTLQTCSSLLTNVSTLIVTDLANILSPTVQSFAELLSNFATSVQKLSNSADCIGVMNVSSLSKCVTFSALSSELTLALNSLVSGVSGRLVPGQGSFLLFTANLNVAVFSNLHSSLGDTILTSLDAGASIMQRRLQTGSAVSHIELPSSGLDACGTSVSGYSRLALSQFTNNPYVSSSNLETPVLRVASYGSNYAVATIDPNASAVNFTMQLAFTSQQNLQITNGVIINTTLNGSYSTSYSSSQVPICTLRSGDTFVPCDCSLGTYTNDSAIFLCRLRTAFCGLASSSVGTSSPTSQPSMSSGLSSTYEQNPSIQEYGAFIQSIFEVIGTTFQPRNPFESDPSTSTIIVYVVVGCLLIFLIIGLFFLSRRDALDRKVLLYVPEEAAAKKNPVAMTNAELIAQRESLDDAFLSGALISEDDFNESHVEYDRRQRWVRKANAMLAWLLPFSKQSRAQISLLVGGTLLPKFVQSVVRYHPFTAFLIGPSLEKPRVLRFLTLFLSILLSLFITTIIFQVYFPPNNGCSNFNNTSAFECLQEESGILRGQALCEWNADKRICKLRPPPDSASFIIATAVLTAIVFAPLDLFFYVIINLICNRRPKLESIGLDSFYWLGGDMEAASEIAKAVSYVLRAIKGFETALAIRQCSEDELIRVITILGKIGLQIRANKVTLSYFSSHFFRTLDACIACKMKMSRPVMVETVQSLSGYADKVPSLFVFHESKAASYVLRGINVFELRMADDRCFPGEIDQMRVVLGRIGLTVSNGKVQMTWLSLLRYASIERVIRHYVRWASEDAELIVLNMRRYASTTGKDSYLIQRFLLEQMNVVARGLLRRQFCHQEHDLPRTIHPLLWFLGWLIAIAGALFFIIWILFWGTNNDGSSILNWGVNLALHLIAEIFLIALIRILIVNVLLVDLLRPFLQSAYSWFKRLPSDRDILQKRAFRRASLYPNQTDDGMGTISIYQHISPVCIASRYPEFEDLSSSKTICNIQDVDMLHLQRSSGGEEVYAMDEKDVTGRTQQTRGSTHGIFDMVRENHPQNPSNLPSSHEELEAGRN